MPVRGVKPVLQFRGRIRYFLSQTEHYCDVLSRYQVSHPTAKPFTDLELAKVTDCLLLMSAKLAHRVNV